MPVLRRRNLTQRTRLFPDRLENNLRPICVDSCPAASAPIPVDELRAKIWHGESNAPLLQRRSTILTSLLNRIPKATHGRYGRRNHEHSGAPCMSYRWFTVFTQSARIFGSAADLWLNGRSRRAKAIGLFSVMPVSASLSAPSTSATAAPELALAARSWTFADE